MCEAKVWYDEAMIKSNKAGYSGISAAETIKSLVEENEIFKRTIKQTFQYLGEYINDADTATHAKRLLFNCIATFDIEFCKKVQKGVAYADR